MTEDHVLELRADGKWYEHYPKRCSKQHPLLRGWEPCRCGGHRTLDCVECGKTAYYPERGDRCTPVYPTAPDGSGK